MSACEHGGNCTNDAIHWARHLLERQFKQAAWTLVLDHGFEECDLERLIQEAMSDG